MKTFSSFGRLPFLVALLLPIFVVVGCGANKRKADLENSVERYVRALSYGDSRVASTYVSPGIRPSFLKEMKKVEDIRVSHTEVRSIIPDDEIQKALVTVFMEYYPTNGSQVFSEERQFAWAYNKEYKIWLLSEPQPFGQ